MHVMHKSSLHLVFIFITVLFQGLVPFIHLNDCLLSACTVILQLYFISSYTNQVEIFLQVNDWQLNTVSLNILLHVLMCEVLCSTIEWNWWERLLVEEVVHFFLNAFLT